MQNEKILSVKKLEIHANSCNSWQKTFSILAMKKHHLLF
jgi:hypothetical protein